MGKNTYLAGPMSGYADFNFPAFASAAAILRQAGWPIISPHELDGEGPSQDSWGTCLGRDVTVVADTCDKMIFLPEWWKSRGAKLEATVGLLCEFDFYELNGENLCPVSRAYVKQTLTSNL